MTETSCIISVMDEGDNLSGHVGSPNAACGELLNHQKEVYEKKIMNMCLLSREHIELVVKSLIHSDLFLLWFFSFQK